MAVPSLFIMNDVLPCRQADNGSPAVAHATRGRRVQPLVGRPVAMKVCAHLFGVIFPANDCATILPSRTTKVSVPTS